MQRWSWVSFVFCGKTSCLILELFCEIWWWCGSVAPSHSCERSRRNGGRWWPQVRKRWCGCFRNLPHAGDCVKLVQQISGRGIALQVIFDLTDGLGFLSWIWFLGWAWPSACFSRIVAGRWDPQGLSPYDQGTPLQVWAPDRIGGNRRVERCREMWRALAMLIMPLKFKIFLKYSWSTWSQRQTPNSSAWLSCKCLW